MTVLQESHITSLILPVFTHDLIYIFLQSLISSYSNRVHLSFIWIFPQLFHYIPQECELISTCNHCSQNILLLYSIVKPILTVAFHSQVDDYLCQLLISCSFHFSHQSFEKIIATFAIYASTHHYDTHLDLLPHIFTTQHINVSFFKHCSCSSSTGP